VESWLRKALILIGFFVLIVPVGILFTWNYGDAWGEWGEVNLGGETWQPREFFGGAPLPDYNVPGWEGMLMASVGYWFSAVIGIVMCVLITLGVVKILELWKGQKSKTRVQDV